MNEPRDGDFVAYIEALQRESAARLLRQTPAAAAAAMGDHAGEPIKGRAAGTPAAPAPGESPPRSDADARLMKALVAAVVGIALLLVWLGEGGIVPLVIGVALLGYGLPRLRGAIRTPKGRPANRAAVEQVFGRSASGTAHKR